MRLMSLKRNSAFCFAHHKKWRSTPERHFYN
jgi:hypothetical protein